MCGHVLHCGQFIMAERFHLAVHIGEKQMPLYSMKAASSGNNSSRGSKQHGEASVQRRPREWGRTPDLPCNDGGRLRSGGAVVRAELIDRPIVDETGLSGAFDFWLDWTPNQLLKTNGGLTVSTRWRSNSD
jgi:uncharacterized protein (TIGR03435 family)